MYFLRIFPPPSHHILRFMYHWTLKKYDNYMRVRKENIPEPVRDSVVEELWLVLTFMIFWVTWDITLISGLNC